MLSRTSKIMFKYAPRAALFKPKTMPFVPIGQIRMFSNESNFGGHSDFEPKSKVTGEALNE